MFQLKTFGFGKTRVTLLALSAACLASSVTTSAYAEKIGFVSLVEPSLRITLPVMQAGTNVNHHKETLVPLNIGMANVVLGPAVEQWKKLRPADEVNTYAIDAKDAGSRRTGSLSMQTSVENVRGELAKIVAQDKLDKLIVVTDARFPDIYMIKGSFTGIGVHGSSDSVIPFTYMRVGVVDAKTLSVKATKDVRRYERIECPKEKEVPTLVFDCHPFSVYTDKLAALAKEAAEEVVPQLF